MAKKLSFDTGVAEYDINGKVKVRFNPTDSGFVERLYKLFSDLEAKQGEFQERIDEIGEDGEAMFAYAAERDAEMRAMIDGLLGDGVAAALFPGMNCYALADGLPVWVNLMFALAEEVEKAYEDEQGRSDPRIRGYNKKYEAMRAKYKRVK
ncbi:MAG: hypothetical protein HFJ75_07775 [Eggerthellaceae bacterium]|nr:hypothetical protein [Eggerthellaceae bacterium]